MPCLIDGYNLMMASVDPGKALGPNGLRQARTRFLNRLAHRLGPVEAAETTVVFDAARAPEGLPRIGKHKGITVLFVDSGEEADDRLEWLITRAPNPKALTVVSSDHRIRQAAERRRARCLSADEFWAGPPTPRRGPRVELDLGSKRSQAGPRESPVISAAEAAYWREQFRDVDELVQREALPGDQGFIPSPTELERVRREVEREFDAD